MYYKNKFAIFIIVFKKYSLYWA